MQTFSRNACFMGWRSTFVTNSIFICFWDFLMVHNYFSDFINCQTSFSSLSSRFDKIEQVEVEVGGTIHAAHCRVFVIFPCGQYIIFQFCWKLKRSGYKLVRIGYLQLSVVREALGVWTPGWGRLGMGKAGVGQVESGGGRGVGLFDLYLVRFPLCQNIFICRLKGKHWQISLRDCLDNYIDFVCGEVRKIDILFVRPVPL